MQVSVIVPCFNNSDTIEDLVKRVTQTFKATELSLELILVDDGSSDGSWSSIQSFSKEFAEVQGILLSRNFGQHAAILAGLDYASGDLFVLMDADLDDEPECIPTLLESLVIGETDLVLTTLPRHAKSPLTSRLFHFLAASSARTSYYKGIGTFRAFNRKVATALRQYRDHSVLYGPLSLQLGFRQTSIQLPIQKKIQGRSSYRFTKRLRLAMPMIVNDMAIPLRLAVTLSLAMIAAVLLLGSLAVTRFVLGGGDVMSTTSLVFIVLLVNQSLLGVGIASVALYCRQILRETLRRPKYHIAETARGLTL
jgi:dolichol-phosphate mannosyltransferase